MFKTAFSKNLQASTGYSTAGPFMQEKQAVDYITHKPDQLNECSLHVHAYKAQSALFVYWFMAYL